MIPQLQYQLRHQHVVGVLPNKAQDEDTVLAQVLLREFDRHLLVELRLVAVVYPQELFQVTQAVLAENHAVDPDEEIGGT